jgi:multidrug efflux pump
MASTATTLAAFLPIMFWPGVAGQFMSYLPITVFAVLIGSLFYALLFAPTIGALIGRSTDASNSHSLQLEKGNADEATGITGLYAKVLGVAVRMPIIVFFASISTLGIWPVRQRRRIFYQC